MGETVDSLKQRLVGAFVILSLAVIFLPMVFDKPHREGNAVVEQVPPKPMRETVVISRPTKPDYKKRAVESEGDSESESSLPKLVAVESGMNEASATPEVSQVPSRDIIDSEKRSDVVESASSKADSKPRIVDTKVYSNVWMVQLGTFSKQENAYSLRDRLRKIGIDGHTKPIKSGSATRVFAGPFVTKKEALRIKRKLDAE
ncbi:hypothetical protein A3760_32660, partial [Oleiphilus sp. HI0122]